MIEGSDDAQGRERRRVLWLLVGLFGIAALGALVGTLVALGEDVDREPLSTGTEILFIGLSVGAVLLTVALAVGFVLWRRHRGSTLYASSPLSELGSHQQRRRLVRALRRGDRISPEEHDLALRTARDFSRRRGLVWLYLGPAALQAVNVAVQDGWYRWFSVASGLFFLGLAGYWAWLVHRMRRAVRRLETAS